MLDYLLPRASDVPNIRVLHMETPSPHTEFGMKGIGEGGAVGPPAAIVSAVNDALCGVGAEVHDLPLTPARILAAIEAARQHDPQPFIAGRVVRTRCSTLDHSASLSFTDPTKRLVKSCSTGGMFLMSMYVSTDWRVTPTKLGIRVSEAVSP